ncbi:hypothetical protein [Gluconacetobacter entanii]|uniref:Uncharacterized protein n=1 Tax=Gluconacetobacter entanii TaxID=108528 RepID=A0A318Q207_9PROT|nr:hypothetical protein [Gluconacetobacter entanii]MCE2577342.1 hypothetical protein [Komagataeibacter sp. FNDCR1]PYD62933.1 hypothetical protein CFR72_09540 [Gluconacetobacter entanii]
MIQEVYAQAIAARLLVHELDANEGRPPRQFEPLPSYPAPPVEPVDRDEAMSMQTVEDTHLERHW